MSKVIKNSKNKTAAKAADSAQSALPPTKEQVPSVQQILFAAIQYHNDGKLVLAERGYRKILQSNPNQPIALHLLGMIAKQAGESKIAVDLITQALSVMPDYVDAHNNLGIVLKDQGKLDEAVTSYRKAIAIKPEYAEAHFNLGNALQELGQLDEAIISYNNALAIKGDYAEAFNNRGIALRDLKKLNEALDSYQKALAIKPDHIESLNCLGNVLKDMKRLDEAVASYKKALDIKPDYVEAYSNLSIALKEQGKFDEAVASCQKALDIRPNYAEAHNNLGVTLKDLGKPDEAIASFKKAISFKPGYSEAINNLCLALRDQGKMDEAILLLESNLENGPVNVINSDSLTSILNHHMPSAENPGRYSKAQEALQHVMPDYTAASGIGDETVRQLYQECQSILASYKLNSKTDQLQIYRGEHINLGCVRHLRVFKTFNIIPEFCFGCYKVSIEPRTVMELIKLMLVFDILAIPNDRARKCMVEVRPDISGAYKGYIYCKTLEEGKEIAAIVQNIVGEKISKEITISVKRGCSEYSVAYPEYGQIKNNDHQQMKYNEEWRENEEFADNNLIGHVYPPVFNTSNHSGMTLRDVFIMHKWLEYAATIGDLSYLEVSKSPVQKMQIKRPSFQVVDKIKEVKGDSVN